MTQRSKDVQFIHIPLETEITCLMNKSDKLITRLVGFHDYEFLILQFPRIPNIGRYLREGLPLAAHFSQGSSNIFFSSVMECTVEKKHLAICKYPEIFKVFDVREDRRMECLIPVGVTLHDAYYGGVMTDVSEAGCHLVLDVTGGSDIRSLTTGDTLTLELSSQGTLFTVGGEIMHIRKGLSRTALGVAFRDMDNRDASTLTTLIQSLYANQGRRPC